MPIAGKKLPKSNPKISAGEKFSSIVITDSPTIVVRSIDPHDVNIGRPGKWGNPFVLGRDGTREEVIEKYREYILEQPKLLSSLHELKGLRLGCPGNCKPRACHGDVLVELLELLDVIESGKGCKACEGTGLNSKGGSCRACELKRSK